MSLLLEYRRALERIAAHQSRRDRRHPGMVDISEVQDLKRTARTVLLRELKTLANERSEKP
jgi:hypothetical protein